MKLHELAKSLGFKSPDVLNKAKELGLQIGGITTNLKDDEIEILTKVFENVPKPPPPEEKIELDTIPHDLKKGALIGLVFDGTEYKLVTVRLTLEQVKKYEHEVISSHTSVNGGLINLGNKYPRYVNTLTVKNFKEE